MASLRLYVIIDMFANLHQTGGAAWEFYPRKENPPDEDIPAHGHDKGGG